MSSDDAGTTNGAAEYLFRYEDILRAIGRYVDTQGIQDVVLLQLRIPDDIGRGLYAAERDPG